MPNTVSTLVYKYNPRGFFVMGVYIVGLVVFISQIQFMSTAQNVILGCIFLAVPLYLKYGDSKEMSLRTWDERKLIFTSSSIDFGDDHYQIGEMETAAVYLESFNGFTYRAFGDIGRNGTTRVVDITTDGEMAVCAKAGPYQKKIF